MGSDPSIAFNAAHSSISSQAESRREIDRLPLPTDFNFGYMILAHFRPLSLGPFGHQLLQICLRPRAIVADDLGGANCAKLEALCERGAADVAGKEPGGEQVARVWLKPGTGKITVNGRDQEVYFARPTLRLVIDQPFQISDRAGQYDVVATVKGGGLSGQAGAVKHGISQALSKFEPQLRLAVKAAGFLTRDPRVVERKKYGRAKARKSFQFSKR